MPIGFNSPARNFFLLGSSGVQTATNFFKAIDQSSTTDGYFNATGIKYSSYDEKYILSGSADNSQAISFGFLEKREEDGTLDWNNRIQSSLPSGKLDLTSLELDTNGDLIVGGLSNSAPWIAKYSNTGGLVWLSTTNTGDARYFGIGIDSSNNYYAAGRTERNNLTNPTDTNRSNAVVEKYDSNGNTLWGKSVSIGAENASFQKVDVSDTSVICAGYIEDNVTKGYFAKYDSASGVLQWDRTLESKEIDGLGIQEKTSIEDIHVDADGFIYLCGVLSFGEVESNTFNQSRGFITKYTPEGNQLWCREVGIPNFTGYVQYYNIKVDDNTKQVIVFGIISNTNSTKKGLLTKLSSSGKILWHRELLSDRVPPTVNEFQRRVGFDADASFYYIFFTDDDFNKSSGTPDEYTFGKVSSSGNGLGSFVYNPEVGIDIEYTIASSIPNRIGKLQDGSVRNDSSDFISYPFNGTKIMFDDLATPVTNKKAIISDKDIILRSGSPAIRPTDFQELNLLGDVYSGSGDWLDQSGKGNDATTSFTTTTTTSTGGTTSSENFGTGGSITYNTYGTVAEGVTATLPYSTSDWDHYNSKVRDLQSGGFKITTSNSATNTFFMGCWVKFDTYAQSRQMGINLGGNYVYWETRSNGKIGIRHDGGSREDSAETNIGDGNWHYISLSRAGSTLAAHVDGSAVVSTTDGVSGNSVPSNADFWFFGGSGTSYNIDGKILDPIINIGTGQTGGYTTPTKPIIDSSGNFNGGGSGSGPFFSSSFEYASPAIALDGSTTTTTTTNGPTYNAAGYWEFDGTDDYISVDTLPDDFDTITVEMWSTSNQSNVAPIYRTGVLKSSDGTWTDGFGFFEFANPSNNNRTLSWFVNAWSGSQTIAVDVSSSEYTQFTHWVGTYDGSNMKLYKNGVLLDTSAYTAAMVNSDKPLFIGAGESAPYTSAAGGDPYWWWWDGDIGDVRIYPKALTPAQVFQNYNATKSKYINEAPSTAPKISDSAIVYGSDLLLNYDFGNRATYDRAENLFKNNSFVDREDYNSTTNGNWAFSSGPTSSTVGPNVISPVGDLTGGTIVYDGTDASAGGIAWSYKDTAASADQNQIQFVDGDVVTYSVYAKIGSSNNNVKGIYLRTYSPETAHAFFLDSGTKAAGFNENNASPPSGASAAIEDVGNGWYRCSITLNITANDEIGFQLYLTNAGGATGFNDAAGAGDTIHAWGAQVERNSSAGRPIKTYGTAITAPTTVKNISSNSFPGTITGATFNSAGYFEFDGTDNYIQSSSVMAPGSADFSVIMWYKITGTAGRGGLFERAAASPFSGWVLGQGGDLDWSASVRDASNNNAAFQYTFPTVGEWTCDAFTWDVSTQTLTPYRNGANAGTATNSGTVGSLDGNSRSPMAIGARLDSASPQYKPMECGEVQMYTRALSSTEVSQNFNATKSKYGL